MKKSLFLVGLTAVVLFLSPSFLKGESLASAKEFLGKFTGEWDYQGGPGTSPLLRNNKFSWKATVDIKESNGRILVTYWESECLVLLINAETYENCPWQITLAEGGKPVLSFSFFETRTGWTRTIKLKKNEQGEFEGTGRTKNPATIIMRRVN